MKLYEDVFETIFRVSPQTRCLILGCTIWNRKLLLHQHENRPKCQVLATNRGRVLSHTDLIRSTTLRNTGQDPLTRGMNDKASRNE